MAPAVVPQRPPTRPVDETSRKLARVLNQYSGFLCLCALACLVVPGLDKPIKDEHESHPIQLLLLTAGADLGMLPPHSHHARTSRIPFIRVHLCKLPRLTLVCARYECSDGLSAAPSNSAS